tara:strand:+ start:1232 stop:1519 length:288 start_codon:yes stop_codon:yes gene_type:complete
MTYYNTTKQKGEQLKASWKRTETQDKIIMEYFRRHGRATPSQVWLHFVEHEGKVPITSIRRSITNLTSYNMLLKTEKKKEGIYGRPEYVWRLLYE